MATAKPTDKEHGHNNQIDGKETPDKSSVLRIRRLSILTQEEASEHVFTVPVKRIHDGHDVTRFLSSKAYRSIMTFLYQLNTAMYPRTSVSDPNDPDSIQTWELDSPSIQTSNSVKKLQDLFRKLEEIIDEAPPDPGPQRFGNVSFRTWYKLVEERLPVLLKEYLPAEILANDRGTKADSCDAKDELLVYLLGSFGSAQRLDYGTGHELSFLAFLGCIWLLRGFTGPDSESIERSIVIGLIQPYLQLVRHLIKIYNLEPAGSHGVWGLDDHSFLPYIFGSAQYSPVLASLDKIPMEGSRLGAPAPGDVVKPAVVAAQRSRNMYFSAIGFIQDVKKGPFWEHSPILYDISGVRAGWAKINKGMIKMYSAEVLSKFPVVQHFPFGSLFSWELDPEAVTTSQSVHTSSHPTLAGSATNQVSAAALRGAPQATARTSPSGSTGVQGLAFQSRTPAPWATK